jgi:hypothetical protein
MKKFGFIYYFDLRCYQVLIITYVLSFQKYKKY